MLNDEGWVLLLFLVLFISILLLGLRRLKADSSMTERLTVSEGDFSRNTGVFLRLTGSCVLCVVPGMLYRNSIPACVSLLSLLTGTGVLLFVLLPKIKDGNGLTPAEALSLTEKPRAYFAFVSLLPTFILLSAALSLAARFVSGVFSLHYVIALSAVTGITLLLCLLKNNNSRSVSYRYAAFLPVLALAGLIVYLAAVRGDLLLPFLKETLQIPISFEESLLPLLSCACMGLGVPGLLLPIQRSVASPHPGKKKNFLAFVLFALCLLSAGFSGFFGSLVDASLSDAASCETILLQLASWAALPSPVRGAMCAVLILLPLLYVSDGLKTVSSIFVWDILPPAPDKKLLSITRFFVLILAVLLFLSALPEKVPLTEYATLALLLSAPLGMVFLTKKRSGKRTLLALLFGELICVAGFICSLLLMDLGFVPAFPAALCTLLILRIGG